MNPSALQAEVRRLASAWCDGGLTDEQFQRLQQLLSQHSEARREFHDVADLHGELSWSRTADATSDADLDALADAASPRGDQGEDKPTRRLPFFNQPMRFSLIAAALVVTMLLTAMALMSPPFYRSLVSYQEQKSPATRAVVAQLTGQHEAAWGDPRLDNRKWLTANEQLELTQGLAEINFRDGTRLVLEGPAMLELQSRSTCRLQHGSAAVSVPKQAIGFTISTPVARVVDLGTEFGVSVENCGATNVAVFAGKVRVESEPAQLREELRAHRTLRIEPSGSIDRKPAPRQFTRSLPLRSGRVSEVIAYNVLTGATGTQEFGGSLGHDFVVTRPINVTCLGVFDSGADGLQRTLTAELWLRDESGTPEDFEDDRGVRMLRRLTFTPSDPGTLVDSSRFKRLPQSLLLLPGAYTIIAHGYGANEPNGNRVPSGPNDPSKRLNDGLGALRFVGISRYGDVAGEFADVPADTGNCPNKYSAGTFAFQVLDR